MERPKPKDREVDNWKQDKPVKRPVDEIEVPVSDKRKNETRMKVVDFGWEGPD